MFGRRAPRERNYALLCCLVDMHLIHPLKASRFAELLGRPRIIMLGLRLVMHLCIEYLVHIFLFAFFLFSVQLLYNKLYID